MSFSILTVAQTTWDTFIEGANFEDGDAPEL